MAGFEDRIIAGAWKGRGLWLPDSKDVRPSKNRVRQAVFNILGSRLDWHGLAVADICCGSGAWGLEAASRGAEKVFLVDIDVRAAEKNVAALAAAQVEVIRADARNWRPPALLDVILTDPPYDSTLVQDLLRRAAEIGKPGSWWAVEVASGTVLDWAGFEVVKTARYGGSEVVVGRRVHGFTD